jgi:hypothetical protein
VVDAEDGRRLCLCVGHRVALRGCMDAEQTGVSMSRQVGRILYDRGSRFNRSNVSVL